MKNLVLLFVAVLGISAFATAAPVQTKPVTPVKEVAMGKPTTHKHKKAKKAVAKMETSKTEMKK